MASDRDASPGEDKLDPGTLLVAMALDTPPEPTQPDLPPSAGLFTDTAPATYHAECMKSDPRDDQGLQAINGGDT